MPKLPTFTGFLANAFPFFANDAKGDVDLTPRQMDELVSYQLMCRQPRYLEAHALLIAGIVDNEPTGEKAFRACVKNGYIVAAPAGRAADQDPDAGPAAAAGSPMTVNTGRVDKHLANKLFMISVHAQRKLVGLLFFWEEECNRWRMLDEEEKNIHEAMNAGDAAMAAEMETMLESVRRRKAMVPSLRSEGTGNVIAARPEQLPVYGGAQQ